MRVSGLGGSLDVGERFGNNPQAETFLAGTPSTGNNTGEQTIRISTAAPRLGDWFSVPDSSIRGVSGIAFVTKYLILPDGSEIALENDEFTGTPDLRNYNPFGRGYTFHNCRVKLTANTKPGLVALGLVPRDQPVPTPRPSAPGPLDRIGDIVNSTSSGVKSYATAIIVVALVVGAVYFVPRNAFRKGA